MMGAEMRAALVRRHVIVAEEQQAIAAGVLDHNLRVACIAHALLNAQPVPPASVAAPSVAIIAQRARQDNMWARLGLGHEPINGIPKVAEACFSSPEGDCHGAV